MKSSIDKLYKFLRLEVDNGYNNKAVIGGLQKIVSNWESEARADGLSEATIRAVSARLRDYHQLTVNSRAETIQGVWRRIQRSEAGDLPALVETSEARPAPSRESRPTGRDHTKPKRPESSSRPDTNPAAQPAHAPARPAASPAEVEAAPSNTVTPPVAPEAQSTNAADDSQQPVSVADKAKVAPSKSESDSPDKPIAKAIHPEQAQRHQPAPVKPKKPRRSPGQVAPPPVPEGDAAALEANLTVLPGVGPKHAESLERLELFNLGHMLHFYPRRYDDFQQLKPINRLWYGDQVTVIGTVESVSTRPIRSGKVKVVEAVLSDGTGALRITWFNQPWLVNKLKNQQIKIWGKIDQYLGRLVMTSPEWEPLAQQALDSKGIEPVYPLTSKITQRWLRDMVHKVVDYWAPRLRDPLPEALRKEADLFPLATAVQQVHSPDSWDELEAGRHRLAFDEVFQLQLSVMQQRRLWTTRTARKFAISLEWLQAQFALLPYTLTDAQQTSIDDIRTDLASGQAMNRLLQGDVGSGKTVVAAMAIAMVIQSSAQVAIMAPTSILAEQHFAGLSALLASEGGLLQPHEIRLLIGSTPESEKQAIREALAAGTIKLLIGTHALIEPGVQFTDLQMVIIDEQHRFGVKQRATLREKGESVHMLVMTATPIPRSLALTVYGDLDLSVIDEMPPGREPVDTFVLRPVERERAYTLVRKQVEEGRQAFMIYPLVEESEKSEARAAVEEHKRLQDQVFSKQSLGLLHGRLKPAEKEKVMAKFRDGEHQILVSTSVVEVGVDVPNATVMVIEGANRFGLAQLHQFRGRVGRGGGKSYCLLVADAEDAAENERLEVMSETSDGFVLAEHDLEQRGPGDFLGTRQSGYAVLKMAAITDVKLIEKARKFAQRVFEQDPDLEAPEHQLLAKSVRRFWRDAEGDVS
jgi:ATP-dependent DNA helicase RecG